MSRIDVIVPCYRYAHFLRECVESILTQPIREIRVLIIDDASPDNTAEVAAALMDADSRVEFLRHNFNRGHIATYNEGLEWASADYTLLISADDFVTPGALFRAVRVLDAQPEAGFVYGPFIEFRAGEAMPNLPTAADDGRWIIQSGRDFIKANRHYNPVHTSTVVVRTSLQKRLGGYRSELTHSGDQEMWMRFAVHAPVGYIRTYQGIWRKHGENMSEGYYRNMLLDLHQRKAALDAIFDTYGDCIPNGTALRVEMNRGLADAAVRVSSLPFSHGNLENCDQILQFAVDVHPDIRYSLLWLLQAWKRRLGPTTWSAIRPVVRPLIKYVFARKPHSM